MQIAIEYGKRLNLWSDNLREKALAKLVSGYPSHEFVIDRREAQLLFSRVAEPTDDESALNESLEDQITMGMAGGGSRNAVIKYLSPEPHKQKENGKGTATDSRRARTRSSAAGQRSSGNGKGTSGSA